MRTHSRTPVLSALTLAVLTLCGCSGNANAALSGGFFINTRSRETVRNFHNAVYNASEGMDMGWTGNTAGCKAGTVSDQYRKASLTRVNFFRALAGVPANIGFLDEFNRKAQAAALMMLANQQLSHSPPTHWLCHSADGASGADNSNLGLGMAGPDAISQFMDDGTDSLLGHRRWIIYPQTRDMGLGSVVDNTLSKYKRASALWVIDDAHGGGLRPKVRDDFVAWPPRGYLPYPLLYRNWSLSYPGADFGKASVRLTRNGSEIPVTLYPPRTGLGENTLVWAPVAELPASRQDQTYHVVVSNVLVGGSIRKFEYNVTGFDPALKGPDSVVPVISGNTQPGLKQLSTYAIQPIPIANGYQRLLAKLNPVTGVEGAENGAGAFNVDIDQTQYAVVTQDVAATGASSFHLAHTVPELQSLTWKAGFFVGKQAKLSFDSRLGWSSPNQYARLEASLDDGTNWQTVYQQAGTGNAGEDIFTTHTVSLAPFAGYTIRLRFAYALDGGYFFQSDPGVGWYVDNIRMTQVSRLSAASVVSLGKSREFSFTPETPGSYLLQARATAFGGYALEWGPGLVAQVAP